MKALLAYVAGVTFSLLVILFLLQLTERAIRSLGDSPRAVSAGYRVECPKAVRARCSSCRLAVIQ